MNRQKRSIVIAAVFIFIIGIGRVAIEQDPFRDLLHTVTEPISGVFVKLKPETNTETAQPDALLSQQNSELEAENRKLRDELELGERYGEVVTAEIERTDTDSFRKTIWTNRGKKHGVHKGQAVLHDRFLVGVVASSSNYSSEIQLITDPDFRATAVAGGANGVVKLSRGSLVFDLVPKKDVEGDLLVTDGIDGKFSPGIPIANVGERIDEQSGVFSIYYIQLPNSLVDIKFVSIVTGS